ncbi:MAG: hypothetical protein JNN30_09185 [Rhodanobacteraceae bacterium]|nr:hypothetical protein [Rhodanobacteraceae bacterium]
MRAAEAAHAKVSDFTQRRGRRWLRVVGKGSVQGEVPISQDLLDDFAWCPRFFELPPTSLASDHSPIILPIAGRCGRALPPTSIYPVVKGAFAQVADDIADADPAPAALLRRTSTH